MLTYLAKKIVGTRNDRVLKSLRPLVNRVNELEKQYEKLSDQQLAALTSQFKERLSRNEHIDSLQAEAFAAVREASKRTLGMRHFDVQLIGGAVLHKGMIAEMKTGEGKTLVATLAAYLNSLSGNGVHVVTVNDYLARRDSEWMGRIYNFLGTSVGVVYPGVEGEEKKRAYDADITYGQNNEFGFDYLRDNMKFTSEAMFQRAHHFAIVDEVDSILIDEARTPLIISGPAEDSSELYYKVNSIIPRLEKETHFQIDLKSKQPTLTEDGIAHCEKLLNIENLYAPEHLEVLHHVTNALKAHSVMERDVDYVVRDGQVIIVDEFTGRLMAGRRWSNGLHQAVEAKEGLKVARENQTLASITFQNYFRMYRKLSGMTGTADTEAAEFKQIYGLEVIVIPTNKPMIRLDESDKVFRTRKEKYAAAAEDIEEINSTGQPILVGTISIEQSESLSRVLTEAGVKHNVLNAKHHEREAEIVAQAGRLGAVTISTNMAGRGTDIVLGGNPDFLAMAEANTKDRDDSAFTEARQKYQRLCEEEKRKVLELGGLFIMGTERHEARRIDNQLRGRAGRQGDPGRSRFYVSLEDDLMQRFGGDRIKSIMQRLGWEEGLAIDGRMISRSIEGAQRKVESFHFEARKHVTEYDDVMNKQRQVIYGLRARILRGEDVRKEILEMIDDLLEDAVLSCCDEKAKPAEWDFPALKDRFRHLLNRDYPLKDFSISGDVRRFVQETFDQLRKYGRSYYQERVEMLQAKLEKLDAILHEYHGQPEESKKPLGKREYFDFEQHILLETLDHYWNQHIREMELLREGIGLRGYGQKNPLYEYQREGFELFQSMLKNFHETVVRKLFFYEPPTPEQLLAQLDEEKRRRAELEKQMQLIHSSSLDAQNGSQQGSAQSAGQKRDPHEQRAKLLAQKKARKKALGREARR